MKPITSGETAVSPAGSEPQTAVPVRALRTALVVDDSALHRTFECCVLRQAGFDMIYEARDGSEALDMLAMLMLAPDLMLIDLEMPNMDGIELIQQLGRLYSRIPLIVCSSRANGMSSLIEALGSALKLPLMAVIPKPLSEAALRSALETCLPSRPGEHPAAGMPQPGELAAALASGTIHVHYQPQLSLANGMLVGIEALARWTRNGAPVGPNHFIPLAESSGLITPLTYSIVDQALDQLTHWRRQGLAVRMAVNLSPLVLSEADLVEHLLRRCAHYGAEPAQLVLEITESAVVPNSEVPLGALARLRLKGFGLSIDDYGTGYSALQQLARIPFSELKIDRSFVNSARGDRRSMILLRSMVQMARQLEMHSVAEGVETAEEWALLRELGCDVAQGYLIAKPMGASDFSAWFKGLPKLRDRLDLQIRSSAAA